MVIKMNKKLLIFTVIVLIFFSIKVLYQRNDYTEVTESAYVSSMGLEYNNSNNEYTVYMYILNNYNLSLSEYGQTLPNDIGYICVGKGKTISEGIAMINKQSSIRLQYSHIRTVILKNNFFNKNNLLALCTLVRQSPDFFPTFQVYTTSNDLMDIYNVKNFSGTSAYYTILINNATLTKPSKVVFSNLINNIYLDTYTTEIPILKVSNDVFFEQEKELPSIDVDGYSYITDDYRLSSFSFDNYHALYALNNLSRNVLVFKDFDYLIHEYYIKKYYKKNTLTIKITIKGTFIYNPKNLTSNELYESLKQQMTDNLIELKESMDSYLIDVYNIDYLSNRKHSYLDTTLNVDVTIM